MPQLTGELEDWNDVVDSLNPTGLLVGNGASRNVWDGFGYDSLYAIACEQNTNHRLDDTDQRLFDELETRNFERVLAGLTTATLVNASCSIECAELEERRKSIRSALAEAVRTHHVPWEEIESKVRFRIRDELLGYRYVYSTNYDLLVYWSLMAEAGDGFKDYFWSHSFDLGETEVWGDATRVLYLHGGLHLCRGVSGETIKRRAGEANLLEAFDQPCQGELVTPLFVAEGTSADKLRSIYRSDYLSFAYSRLANHRGGLCVFGLALGDEDTHIAKAIRSADGDQVAISLRPASEQAIVERKASYIQRLPNVTPRFYDATTHPLGSKDLQVGHSGL